MIFNNKMLLVNMSVDIDEIEADFDYTESPLCKPY